MKFRRQTLFSVLLTAGVLVLASSGCQEEPSSSESGAASRPGPEESFVGIVQFVRRQLETGTGTIPSGFVLENRGRRSQFIVRNDVTSEVIAPTTADKPYRGTITVTSHSTYSIRRSEEADKADNGSESNSEKNTGQRSLLDESDPDDAGFDVFDGDLISAPSDDPDSSAAEPTTVVSRQVDKNESTFEFAYESGRWVLKTEPDADTERAIKRAFERALRMQP
jgi:hypothetical protein